MKRKSKLLNVVSIIIIVLSALGLLGTLATIAMSGMLEPYYEAYGITPPAAGDYAFSLVLTVIERRLCIFISPDRHRACSRDHGRDVPL